LKWRFRVGTEPDLNPGDCTGTKEQWLKHYDYTVAAVRGVLPGAEIGPGNVVAPLKARRKESWAPAIINHCASGTNHVSVQTGSPLDFFGSSYYTTVGRTDKNFDDVFRFLRNKLDSHPEFSSIPIQIQEFGILSEGGKRIIGDGTEFGGSWFAHMVDKTYQNHIRRVYQWDWNTNKGGDLPTPITHVMDMLEEMAGGTRLSAVASQSSEQDHLGCIAAKNGDRIELLVFRHLAKRANGQNVPVRLTLDGKSLASKAWTLTQANLVDGDHAGFMDKRDADVKKTLAKFSDQPRPDAVALRRAMAANRNEYELISKLHSLDPLTHPTTDEPGESSGASWMVGKSSHRRDKSPGPHRPTKTLCS
jgi:hypothetical protein